MCPKFGLKERSAETCLAKSCLAYLVQTTGHESVDFWDLNPLACYAGLFWLKHWENSAQEWEEATIRDLTVDLFDARKPYFKKWMKVAVVDRPWAKNKRNDDEPSDYTPLYCAAWYGLEHVVEWIIQQVSWGKATPEGPCGLYGHPLQAAAKRGHFNVVKLLLSAKVDVDAESGRHGSAVCAAASEGHTNIVRELLGFGAVAQHLHTAVFDDRRRDPLYVAVEKGSLETVALLLAHGARDYRAGKAHPVNALHHATRNGRLDIVKELLRYKGKHIHGVSISQRSASQLGHTEILAELAKYGMGSGDKVFKATLAGDLPLVLEGLRDGAEADVTPALYYAVSGENLAICEALLDGGADPTMLAVAARGENLGLVRLLADAGADVNPRWNLPICQAVKRKRWEIVEFLIERGADMHMALQDVVLSGDAESFEKLIHLGADINRQGCEILQAAARGGNVAIIEYLLKIGIDIDTPGDSSSITPLMEAIRSIKWKAMRFLLNHGANVNAIAPPGHAQPHNTRNVIEDLNWVDYDGLETPVTLAARVGAGKVCVELIKRGATIRTESPVTSGTPLLYAVWEQLPRLVDELLQHGADPNQRGTVLSQWSPKPSTPLLLAIEKKNIAIIHRLMAAGADVNGQDTEGFSPLHLAAVITSFPPENKDGSEGEDTEILKLLIHRYHADVNGPRLLNGSLPIHSAASRGTVEHVQILVNAGSNVNALNNDRRTPMHWAAERGRWDAVELLLDIGADPQIRSTEDGLQTVWDLAQAAREQPLWTVSG